jgi:hypothetical protein
MRKLAMCVAAAAAGALLAVSATAASAADDTGWQPTHTDPFEFATGALCPFGLKGEILYGNEFTRAYQNIEEFTGPLGTRFRNVVTGRTVDRDITGFIRVLHQPDGSREFGMWATASRRSTRAPARSPATTSRTGTSSSWRTPTSRASAPSLRAVARTWARPSLSC